MSRDVKEIHEELVATFSLLSLLIDEISEFSELSHSEVSGYVDEIATMLDEIYDVDDNEEASIEDWKVGIKSLVLRAIENSHLT